LNEEKESFWQMIRRNRIYCRIFFGLLTLSFTVLAAFYLIVNLQSTFHHRAQIAGGNLDLLSQSASAMEITLEALEESMRQVLWNRDFIDYMVTPNSADFSRTYRLTQQLNSSVSNSPLVKKSMFYSTLSDTVFFSSILIETRSACSDPVMLEASALHAESPVVFYQGRLFLMEKLDIARPIGRLVYELDRETLLNEFFRPAGTEREILVFDGDLLPVFDQEEAREIDWDAPMLTQEDVSPRTLLHPEGYYAYTSPSGWRFLLPVDRAQLTTPFSRLLAMYIPVFLLLFCCSALFAWHTTRTTYRPIRNLLRLAVRPEGKTPAERRRVDEMEFLEGAFSDAVAGQAQLEAMLSSIAPEILESMLKNLLVGKSLTEDRVREILAGVGEPFHAQGSFFVIACAMRPPQDREIKDVELNLHLLAIRNLVGSLENESYKLYDIHTEKLVVALVCCFPEGRPAGFLTQEYRKIKRLLQSNTELLPLQLCCERGNIYPSVWDIRFSYREAVEKTQYIQYMQSTPETGAALRHEMDQPYFQRRAREIVTLTAGDAWPQARAALMGVLDEIGESAPDLERYKRMVQTLMDETLERVIAYPLAQEDQAELSRCRMRLEDENLDGEQDVVTAVKESYEIIFRLVASYSKKNRYKYIETAKTYISGNYMDSGLSLNKVSDHVGISASYLSELFNELVQEKFSSYLNAFRVEKARQLLQATSLTSREVGFRCGFNSVQNFIRVFKKYSGKTPGQFREETARPED